MLFKLFSIILMFKVVHAYTVWFYLLNVSVHVSYLVRKGCLLWIPLRAMIEPD